LGIGFAQQKGKTKAWAYLVVLLAAGEAQGPEDDLNRSGGYDLDTLRRRRRERWEQRESAHRWACGGRTDRPPAGVFLKKKWRARALLGRVLVIVYFRSCTRFGMVGWGEKSHLLIKHKKYSQPKNFDDVFSLHSDSVSVPGRSPTNVTVIHALALDTISDRIRDRIRLERLRSVRI